MSKKKKKTAAKKSVPKTKKESPAGSRRGAQQCPEPPPGTVRSKVIAIIGGLTAARPITDTASLDDLALGQQRLTMCLNEHFFPRPSRQGIPNGTFDGETRVSQVIGTVHHQLAGQGPVAPES